MTKVDNFRNVILTTSGDPFSRPSYAKSETYKTDQSDSSNMTIGQLVIEYKTRGFIVQATTPSTRKQDRISQLNDRLRKLAK